MWQPGRTLEEIERETILKALSFYRGNRTHTAESLGIAIRTLQNKLSLYGVQDEASGVQAPARNEVEHDQDSTQPSVPVRKPEEVQKVPPSKHASHAARKHG